MDEDDSNDELGPKKGEWEGRAVEGPLVAAREGESRRDQYSCMSWREQQVRAQQQKLIKAPASREGRSEWLEMVGLASETEVTRGVSAAQQRRHSYPNP